MKPSLRRIIIGTLAGVPSSVGLVVATGHPLVGVLLGAGIGAAYSASLRPAREVYIDSLMAAASLGLPLWAIISVIVLPLLSGQMPEWNAAQMRQQFPALVGWVIYGAALGLATQALTRPGSRLISMR
jgi:hypothetical protein